MIDPNMEDSKMLFFDDMGRLRIRLPLFFPP
jgi:hypothetical protein